MNKPTVLIVDFDRVIADTLVQIFCSKGFDAKAFYDVETALTASDDWHPNLAILNSVDCAIRLKERYPDCQIILLYAVAPDVFIQKALDLNFEVLIKPVPPEELLATARTLLEANH